MNAQVQLNNAAEASAVDFAPKASAKAQALTLNLKNAMRSETMAGNKVRDALWATLDAFRAGEVTEAEAVAIAEVFVSERISDASRGKYRQRFRAVMGLEADAKAEERAKRDPFAYGGALERKTNAEAKRATEAEERAKAVKRFNREAGQALAAKMGEDFTADFALENLPEITARAAILAEKASHHDAIVAALKAAKDAGLSREYVEAEVAAIFA